MKAIVFLGPSLPLRDAKKLLRADFRPPARQGDVFRAIDAKPDVIVLIDGVFESAPSVWHHELLAAHASGITLLGASSMGALRAAELPGVVTPIGEIARRFAAGTWNDDAAVALLHGRCLAGLPSAHRAVGQRVGHRPGRPGLGRAVPLPGARAVRHRRLPVLPVSHLGLALRRPGLGRAAARSGCSPPGWI